ncbi:hypothetical protein LAZ67_5001032 [Cordylochernes scorpioides]|uniref:Reverse transcriptase domain-containing protein n=1 Tax=Cordylochernes scorpioides TaxID=51811 RepID=A0ABY6KFA4_9ARAC|nr:hypothetical protein LAZ67_5001032 [Cordylochernes scorpioides]
MVVLCPRRISKGCPQGSVLGPFLWNIVFDELLTLDYRNNVFPQAYADDLVVVVSGCRPSQLPAAQHTIDMIARWCSLHKLELSVGKCQAMVLLRPHGRLPEPRRDLVIHGRPIQWCDSIKVLGVRFDQRLSFYQHVVEVCAKVRGMLPRLTAAANLNFGFGYRALRTLYLQVVVPAIAYASAVWFPNLSQRSLNVLLSAQRPFLVRACRAFRSTSNAALISLSRVLPLDLEILAKTELYLKKYGLVDAEIPLEPPPFPHPLPYPPYYSAPSNIPALFFHVAYYTDGSKTRDGVGAGVYRFSCLDCAPEIRESHVLSPHCSVFQAEALGLVKALENATTLPNHLTLGFFLDNLSVVKSVLNSKTGNYLIDRALLLISRLNRNGNRCTIQWIKGHSGNNNGNGQSQNNGNGQSQNNGNSQSQNNGNGQSQRNGNGQSQNNGNGQSQNNGNSQSQNNGNGQSQRNGIGQLYKNGNGQPQNNENGQCQTKNSVFKRFEGFTLNHSNPHNDKVQNIIRPRTISRRLVANGLHSCRPLRRLPLTPPNRHQRLEWCRARSTWMTKWHRVVFSDESRFCLSSDSRRVRVWRRRGERSNPAANVERFTVRQRGIVVWGAIAYDSRSPLLRIQGTMTAKRYVDDVLRPVTLPYLQGVPNALYQQDNARPHTARISQQALQDVQMLPWPPYSPDLSPIEHVWDIIGRRLHALPQPRSEDELWQMVEREWRAIPQDAIRTLIDSLPRRVAACIAVRGGPTCY